MSNAVPATILTPGIVFYTSLACLVGGLVLFGASLVWKWRSEIELRVQQVQSEVGKLVMTRRKKGSSSPSGRSRMASQLDISDNYKAYLKEHYPDISIMSLGEYLDSLQPGAANMLPQHELDTLLAAALIRVLGPSLGGALIPALGALPSSAKMAGMAAVAKVAHGGGADDVGAPIVGSAAVSVPSHVVSALSGISLMSILGAADVALSLTRRGETGAVANDKQPLETPLLTFLKLGEIETPTFDPLPNPFILSEHWQTTLKGLEQKVKEANGGVYNPDEYPSVEPAAVREALLPDLYIGNGTAVRTHTNRQILQNRLFSVLLNRLAANLIREEVPGVQEFAVQLAPSKEVITYPSVFIQVLMNSGHKVRARSSCRVTTFGFALCVKEVNEDDSSVKWINVPLGLPLRSGIQAADGTQIPGYLTHSCTDFSVSGPVLDGILVESYHNQEGFCGWISGHYTNLPFMFDSISYEVDPVRATQLSAMLSLCINSIAMRMSLPNGGYGTIGVCNDSSAVVDFALRGTTHIYPLVHIGGVYYQVVKRSKELIAKLKTMKMLPPYTLDSAMLLHKTLVDLPNDIHPIPKTFPDTVRRILSSMPKVPQFVAMEETIRILKEEFAA